MKYLYGVLLLVLSILAFLDTDVPNNSKFLYDHPTVDVMPPFYGSLMGIAIQIFLFLFIIDFISSIFIIIKNKHDKEKRHTGISRIKTAIISFVILLLIWLTVAFFDSYVGLRDYPDTTTNIPLPQNSN